MPRRYSAFLPRDNPTPSFGNFPRRSFAKARAIIRAIPSDCGNHTETWMYEHVPSCTYKLSYRYPGRGEGSARQRRCGRVVDIKLGLRSLARLITAAAIRVEYAAKTSDVTISARRNEETAPATEHLNLSIQELDAILKYFHFGVKFVNVP